MMQGLKELWADIEKNPPHAPPGHEKGGQLAFIIWFGGLALMLVVFGTPIVMGWES